MRTIWVYLTSNLGGKIDIGVTNDLERQIGEHKGGETPGYARKYNLNRLVYCEEFDSIRELIDREKRIKRWRSAKKVGLIMAMNPEWRDLAPETP